MLPERGGRRRRGLRARSREKLALRARDRSHARGREHGVRSPRGMARRGSLLRSRRGQPVCVVETTKATVEIESPGAGTIVQLYPEERRGGARQDDRVRGRDSGRARIDRCRGEGEACAEAGAGDRKATRKAAELAELHGIDLVCDREARLHHREGRRGAHRAAEGVGVARRRAGSRWALDRRRHASGLVRAGRERRRVSSRLSSSRFAPTTIRSALSRRARRSRRFVTPERGSAKVSTSAKARWSSRRAS